MRNQALQLASVNKSYGSGANRVAALRNVSMEIVSGEFVAVMGPSGSGKSSLLSIAGGLDRPDDGAVFVQGTPLADLSLNDLARVRRRSIGFVFQDFNLVPTLSASENVSLPLELDGVSARKAARLASKALESVGIGELGARFLEEMSGGQQQRVAIARAIVGNRQLILADEPTGALDTVTGEEIMGALRDRADAGSSVLLVTHEPRHAAWADRVIFLRDGRIVDTAEPTSGPDELLSASA